MKVENVHAVVGVVEQLMSVRDCVVVVLDVVPDVNDVGDVVVGREHDGLCVKHVTGTCSTHHQLVTN